MESSERNRMEWWRIIILIFALSVLVYAGYHLFLILKSYKDTDDLYNGIIDEYTVPNEAPEIDDPAPTPDIPKEIEDDRTYEDAKAPLTINWDELKKENSDIVGWIYVDSQPKISYPIVHTNNNDLYLHHDIHKNYLYAGSIFLDMDCKKDFSSPVSIIYGHNMRNGSMFGLLKYTINQKTYDENPYFWILTPDGNYRYHIYAEFETTDNSRVYTLFKKGGKEFLAWEKELQKASAVKNNVQLLDDDKTVILSTCNTSAGEHQRHVVIGKCVSTAHPGKYNFEILTSDNQGKGGGQKSTQTK